MAEPTLDPERLAVLRRLEAKTGRDLLGQLFEMFSDQAPLRLAKARQALAGGDLKTVEAMAHSLKGSSLNLGAAALAEACSTLEQLADAGDAAGCVERLAEVEREYEKVALEIEAITGD